MKRNPEQIARKLEELRLRARVHSGDAARDYLDAATNAPALVYKREQIVLAAMALGGDVWHPKTELESVRHDLVTLADQISEVLR